MPNWVKVRSDLSPQRDGYVMLDSTNLQSAVATGDAVWTAPTLVSGIATNANFPIQYRKDANGFVHVQGSFQVTNATSWPYGPIFTLPSGYRPIAQAWSSTLGNDYIDEMVTFWGIDFGTLGNVYSIGRSTTVRVPCMVAVAGSGEVIVDMRFNQSAASNSVVNQRLALGHLVFLAEQ